MTSKWAQKLANQYSITNTQANDYLYSVQRRCLPNHPRYPNIVDIILKKGYSTLPEPGELAEEFNQRSASKSQRPAKRTDLQETHKHRFHPSWREKAILYKGIIEVDVPTKSGREPGVVSHNKFDNERVAPDKLGCCPHGVPDGELCGICNPDEFRQMTGI
jgi:hypothetical protein